MGVMGYDWAHRQAARALLASGPMCWWCGAARATEADHDPPLASMPPGRWRGRLVPSCRACNASRGGLLAAARRSRRGRYPPPSC